MASSGMISPSRTMAAALVRCLDCRFSLQGAEACPRCGRSHPVVDGIVEAIGPLSGMNRIAASFYNGAGWTKFQAFEQVFLWFQGPGPARARRRVLRFLPRRERARVLEVGIGDGANVRLLPAGWTAFGVDIARRQLDDCRARNPSMDGRLILAQAEDLPFEDATFDAVFSVGGFNYFSDHAVALREMRRVARPGAPVVVADERPDLFRFSIASLLGLDALERWSLRATGLDPGFVEMVLNHRIDIPALARAVWPEHRLVPIWNRLGYCLVDPDPWPIRQLAPSHDRGEIRCR
jgi:SAM-dependent methyltransferase